MVENLWLRLDGAGRALNMGLVLDVEPLDDGKAVLRLLWGGTIVYGEQDAQRILEWIKAHADFVPLASRANT